MKIKVVTIAILLSLMLWFLSYLFMQKSYHVGQAHGIVPNLHIKERLGLDGGQ